MGPTGLALDLGAVLPLEPVDDERVVSLLVGLPFLGRGDLGWEGVELVFSFGGDFFGWGADLDTVEI